MSDIKYWERADDRQALIFTPFYEKELVAELFKDEDGDWCYSSEVKSKEDEYLCDGLISEHEARLILEEAIFEHYEDKRDYFQTLMDKFSGDK